MNNDKLYFLNDKITNLHKSKMKRSVKIFNQQKIVNNDIIFIDEELKIVYEYILKEQFSKIELEQWLVEELEKLRSNLQLETMYKIDYEILMEDIEKAKLNFKTRVKEKKENTEKLIKN